MSAGERNLVAIPSQTVGPFFDFGMTTPNAALGHMIGPGTKGERIRLRLRVFDGDAAVVPDAMVELWQADASGKYADAPDHPDATPGQAFLGWGRLGTDEAGTCEFQTVRPGAVVEGDGSVSASHINVCLFARGLLRHIFTRLYFDGDRGLAADPVLALVPAGRRDTLIARLDHDVWCFDIRLQGPHETVFFDL